MTRIYHKLIKKHLCGIYYARLSRWCEAHGISLMGHPEASDDVEEEFYFHIPGQDLIMRRVAPEPGGIREFDSWYWFSNEGEETIETKIYIKELRNGKKSFLINLWDTCAEECICCTGNSAGQGMLQNDRVFMKMKLEHCEMKLLLLLDESAESIVEKYWSELVSVKTVERTSLGDWTERFEQVDSGGSIFASLDETYDTAADIDKDKNTVTYRYVYTVSDEQTLTGAEYLKVRGEEMAECVCNGIFAGVSFYGPHTFRIGHLLNKGENEICLRFTGNAVNLYGDLKVPFGLDC